MQVLGERLQSPNGRVVDPGFELAVERGFSSPRFSRDAKSIIGLLGSGGNGDVRTTPPLSAMQLIAMSGGLCESLAPRTAS